MKAISLFVLIFPMTAMLAPLDASADANERPSIAALEHRARNGDSGAAISLGMRYRDGNGVEQDRREAVKWYRQAADQGDPAGMDNVGFMYLRGWGVPQDGRIAVAFFEAGAEKGNAQARYNLGECHFSGQGVPQDYGKAIEAWKGAAEKGHDNAAWRLAMMHAAGEHVPRDLEKAEALCRELAERGHVNGMVLLGELLHRKGDEAAAREWWEKAAEKGSRQAEALLELAEWRDQDSEPGVNAYVPVDHLFQGWNNCGSTSISMFLRQGGGELTPYDVKRLCPQSPIGTGTDWAHLVAAGKEIGEDWELITFAYDDEGFETGVRAIRERLDRAEPVVIDFTVKREENGQIERYGHTLLVVGYHAERDRFVLKNPNQPSPGIELMTAEELEENWYSSGYSRNAKGKTARPLIVRKE